MGYAEFKPVVKKVNLKPKGEVEIVLTTTLDGVRGKIETLSDMIDQKVQVALESEVVTFSVKIDAKTDKPLISYKVDETGVVREIKQEGEQLELDLNVPKEKQQIREEILEVDRQVVDEFIMELLAPSYMDLPYPFVGWILQLADGDSFNRIASENGMSSGRIVELIDEYRARVAPMAAKWDEWRKSKGEAPEQKPATEKPAQEPETDSTDAEPDAPEVDNDFTVEDDVDPHDVEPTDLDDADELSDWEREIIGESDPEPATDPDNQEPAPAAVDLDAYILAERPSFEDIPYDFPALLERKKAGETWMQIANSMGTRSTVLSVAWNKYKERVRGLIDNGAA